MSYQQYEKQNDKIDRHWNELMNVFFFIFSHACLVILIRQSETTCAGNTNLISLFMTKTGRRILRVRTFKEDTF